MPEPFRIRASDRRFGLMLVAPSVLVLLLIGLFPLVYTLVVSFQQITMTDVDTSFAGLDFGFELRFRASWKPPRPKKIATAEPSR